MSTISISQTIYLYFIASATRCFFLIQDSRKISDNLGFQSITMSGPPPALRVHMNFFTLLWRHYNAGKHEHVKAERTTLVIKVFQYLLSICILCQIYWNKLSFIIGASFLYFEQRHLSKIMACAALKRPHNFDLLAGPNAKQIGTSSSKRRRCGPITSTVSTSRIVCPFAEVTPKVNLGKFSCFCKPPILGSS